MPLGHGNCLARDLGLEGMTAARAAFARAVRDEPLESLRTIDLLDVTLHDAAHGVSRHLGTCTFAAGYVAETTETGRGRLDLMGLAGGWVHQLAHNASILSGIPIAGPRLLRQGALARIEFGTPATIMLDGEIMHGIRAAEVAVLPGALRCVTAR